DGRERIVTTAQKTSMWTGLLANFAPTQRTRQIDIWRQLSHAPRLFFRVSTHRTHTRRITFPKFFVRQVDVVTCIHWQIFVTSAVVIHGTNNTYLVHPLRDLR